MAIDINVRNNVLSMDIVFSGFPHVLAGRLPHIGEAEVHRQLEGIDASSVISFRGFDSDVVVKLLDSQRLAPWDYSSERLCALVFFALLL